VEPYLHSHNTPSWRDAQLKHRDNLTITFFKLFISLQKSVPMAAPSKVRTVFDSSNSGIVGSNPARGIYVSAFFCVVLSCAGSGFATA
jgi:hypothetical protein